MRPRFTTARRTDAHPVVAGKPVVAGTYLRRKVPLHSWFRPMLLNPVYQVHVMVCSISPQAEKVHNRLHYACRAEHV